MKTLRLTFWILGLLLCLPVTSQGQCQNQGCQRPSATGNPNCYTCQASVGFACQTAFQACPQSCTEGRCPPPPPPPPQQIAGGGGGGGDGSCDPTFEDCGCDPMTDFACFDELAARLPKTPELRLRPQRLHPEFAAVRPREPGCTSIVLPKNLLFAI